MAIERGTVRRENILSKSVLLVVFQGVGFSNEDRDKQWTQHQEGFNELLQKLQSNETAEPIPKENELSGKSLELKSQQSRARVQ